MADYHAIKRRWNAVPIPNNAENRKLISVPWNVSIFLLRIDMSCRVTCWKCPAETQESRSQWLGLPFVTNATIKWETWRKWSNLRQIRVEVSSRRDRTWNEGLSYKKKSFQSNWGCNLSDECLKVLPVHTQYHSFFIHLFVSGNKGP